MRYALILILAATSACYVPPRPLPNWQVQRMSSGARVPCSAFARGQRMGDGSKVVQVHRSYVTLRTRNNESVVIPCRAQ